MTKLNYVNRKIGGDKLGQVVVKDVRKRATTGSTHYKAALRDPIVDFDVTGKALNDDSVKQICEAYIETYATNSEESVVLRLEECCFKDNELTAASLESLAVLIWMAYLDLRDLDLSNNKITIETAEDVGSWEIFLCALGSCSSLQRLDLSGNALGSKAFEVVARLYVRDEPDNCPYTPRISSPLPPATPSPASTSTDVDNSMRSLSLQSPSTINSFVGDRRSSSASRPTRKISGADYPFPTTPMTPRTSKTPGSQGLSKATMTRSLGLKHIPYIVLENCSINDTCAMYLSYVLTDHDLPHRLLLNVPSIKAGVMAQRIEEYDMDDICRGIMYQNNKSLGTAGKEVLQFAEKSRRGNMDEAEQQLTDTLATSSRNVPDKGVATPDSRGRAHSAVHGDSPTLKIKSLDTARSRIQGNTIQELGVHSNDLWSAALQMLPISRVLLLETAQKNTNSGIVFQTKDHPGVVASPRTEGPSMLPHVVSARERAHIRSRSQNYSSKPTPGSHRDMLGMIPSIDPDFPPLAPPPALTQLSSNVPVLRLQKTAQGFSLESESKIKEQAEKLREESEKSKEQDLKDQKTRPKGLHLTSQPYKSKLPHGLSKSTWSKVILMSTEAGEHLSTRQLNSIIEYAADRATLLKERDYLGKPRPVQVWNILHGMNCLAYEPLNVAS